jgi:FKBP-type peptidyl-prolyl cis-trans isomerase FklB
MIFKKKVVIITLSSLVVLFSGQSMAQVELDSEDKKFSYAIGTRIGQQLSQQFGNQPDVDVEALLEGLTQTVRGSELSLTEKEVLEIIQAKQQEQLLATEAVANAKAAAGLEFLEQNKSRDGVVVTDSGLQYEIVNAGDEAGDMPTNKDTVVVHYQGTLIDGTVFDSSIARGEPATFSLQSIIPGWIEALQLMRPGDKWAIVVPPNLAYGERGAGELIGPNEVLMFDIELIEIRKSVN